MFNLAVRSNLPLTKIKISNFIWKDANMIKIFATGIRGEKEITEVRHVIHILEMISLMACVTHKYMIIHLARRSRKTFEI